jgi:hypothetical protein
MPFDGSVWDPNSPTNNDLANEIDDNMRDMKQGVGGRMALEHTWPAAQSATNQGGFHTIVTFTPQTGAPGLVYGTSTQVGALYMNTDKNLMFEDSAGTSFMLAKSAAGPVLFAGTGAIGNIPSVTSGGGLVPVVASATNSVLFSVGATLTPTYKALTSVLVISSGQANHAATVGLPSGVNSNEVQAVMVSIGNEGSAVGTSNPDGVCSTCSIDGNRVITAVWRAVGAGGSGTCVANYVVIGVITH